MDDAGRGCVTTWGTGWAGGVQEGQDTNVPVAESH